MWVGLQADRTYRPEGRPTWGSHVSYNDLGKGRYSEPGREYLVTAVTHGRNPVFTDFHATRLLVREMRRLEEDGKVRWLAWVVMPDHLHGLLSLYGEHTLSTAMNDLKGRSARSINRSAGRAGPVWQPAFTTMPCAVRRTGWPLPVTLSPTHSAPGWSRGWATIHIGTASGCETCRSA